MLSIFSQGNPIKKEVKISSPQPPPRIHKRLKWDILLILIKVVIIIGCTTALLIQGQKCFERYFKYETTAILSVKPTGDAPFLSFTICPDYDASYNVGKLREYGIDRSKYQRGAYNTSRSPHINPRVLFDRVTFKLEDIVRSTEVETWDENNSSIVIPVDGTLDPDLAQWVPKFYILYGYCYSLEIFPKLSAFGIAEVSFETYIDIFIMLHHSGQFLDYNTKSKVQKYIVLLRLTKVFKSFNPLSFLNDKINRPYHKLKKVMTWKASPAL